MYYAIVAPGLSLVLTDYSKVKDLKAIYPFCKVQGFSESYMADKFLSDNKMSEKVTKINRYGYTFNTCYVRFTYIIRKSGTYFNYDIRKAGRYLRLKPSEYDVSYGREFISVHMPDLVLNNDKIPSHLIAIFNGIKLLGPYIDVDIVVPDYSIFYALHSYTGNSPAIKRVLTFLHERTANFSITIE